MSAPLTMTIEERDEAISLVERILASPAANGVGCVIAKGDDDKVQRVIFYMQDDDGEYIAHVSMSPDSAVHLAGHLMDGAEPQDMN